MNQNKGLFYLQGVDCRFRPLIGIRCDKIIESEVSAEDMKATTCYFLDYISRALFLPGQVENWVVLIDLKDISIMSIPYSVRVLDKDFKRGVLIHAKQLQRKAVQSLRTERTLVI